MSESRLHGPAECPVSCSGCDGEHHWIEDVPDPEEPHEASTKYGLEAWYSCKHCAAWATCEYVWDLDVEARMPAVVWAGHDPFTGEQVLALLNENTTLRAELAGAERLLQINAEIANSLELGGGISLGRRSGRPWVVYRGNVAVGTGDPVLYEKFSDALAAALAELEKP